VRIPARVLVVPLAIVALAACGSGDASSTITAGDIAGSAADMAKGTARMHMTAERDAGGGSVRTFVIDGEIDGAHDARSMRTQADEDSGGLVQEARTVGDVSYQRVAPPDRLGETPWIRYEPDSPMARLQAASLDASDPFTFLDRVAGVSDVETLGTTTVDGVPVTHARLTIDMAKWMRTLPKDLRDLEFDDRPDTAEYDVWIDAQRRIRRLRNTSVHPQVTFRTQIDFTDFGAPVTIEAPPASEVVDVPVAGAPGSG